MANPNTAWVVSVSPSWDSQFHYTPIKVFTGQNAKQRADSWVDDQPQNGDAYTVEEIELDSGEQNK